MRTISFIIRYASQLLIITHIYVLVAVNVNCDSRSYREQHFLLINCVYTVVLFNYHGYDGTGAHRHIASE